MKAKYIFPIAAGFFIIITSLFSVPRARADITQSPGSFTSISPDPTSVSSGTAVSISGTAAGGETIITQDLVCVPPQVEDPARNPGALTNPQYNIDGGALQPFSLTVTQTGTPHLSGGCSPGPRVYKDWLYSFSFSASTTGLSVGSHTVTVFADDAATGFPVSSSVAFTVTDTCTTCDPGVILSANPLTVNNGGASTLTWTTSPASPNGPDSCSATSGPWSGSKSPAGGSQSTGPLYSPPGNYTYEITCTKAGFNPATASVTVGVTNTADFSITCDPSSYSINPGDLAVYSVTVSGSGGFSDNVNLSVSGVPPPALSSFSTNPISGGSGSSFLSILNTSGVPPGTYTLTLTGQGQSTGISHSYTCNLQVNSPSSYSYSVSPSTLSFSAQQNGALPPSQNITITNTGNQTLTNFTISKIQAWLNAPSPSSIASLAPGASATVALIVNTTALAPNTYSDTVTVNQSQTGSSQTVGVNYTVSSSGSVYSYSVSPASLSFSATQNGSLPAAQNFTITNTGNQTLTGITVSKTATWLNAPASPLPNLAPGASTTVSISVNTTNLTPTTYIDTVTFNHTQAGTQTGNVTYTVSAAVGSTAGSVAISSISPNPADNSITVTGAAQGSGTKLVASTCAGANKFDPKTMTASGWSIAGGSSGSYALSQTQAGTQGYTTTDIHCTKYKPFLYNFTQPFTINTSALANGTYNLTVSALGGNGLTYSDTKSFTVAHPDFTVSCTTVTQTVTQGSSTSYSIHADSINGFSGTVSLTLVSPPSGVSTTGASVVPTGDAALPVSTTTGAAPGTYVLTVRGTSGSLSHTCTTQLIINALPLPTADLKVNQSDNPASITYGDNATLGWSSTNSTSCSVTSSPNVGSWSGLAQADPPGITTPALTADTTFTLSCTGAGGTAQDQVPVKIKPQNPPKPPGVKNENSALNAAVACNQILISWSAATGAESYRVFRSPNAPNNLDNNPANAIQIKDFGNPPTPANPTSFTYIPADSAPHYYFVEAYRGNGDVAHTSARVVSDSPVAVSGCTSALFTEKDISSVNGVSNDSAVACQNDSGPLSVSGLKFIKSNDSITFTIRGCNDTGEADINNFTIADTMTNLLPPSVTDPSQVLTDYVPPAGTFSYAGACAGQPQPTINGSDGSYTLSFFSSGSLTLPAGQICSITYTAKVLVPSYNIQAYLRFQNTAIVSGTDDGNGESVSGNPKTPLSLFSTGILTSPNRSENP